MSMYIGIRDISICVFRRLMDHGQPEVGKTDKRCITCSIGKQHTEATDVGAGKMLELVHIKVCDSTRLPSLSGTRGEDRREMYNMFGRKATQRLYQHGRWWCVGACTCQSLLFDKNTSLSDARYIVLLDDNFS